MDQLKEHGPQPDHVTAALEAGCGALLGLEVARQEMADSDKALDAALREVEEAVTSLRRAIELLYASAAQGAGVDETGVISLGFVLDMHG